MSVSGCSTCQRGQENFEKFRSRVTKNTMVQYDYRTPDGELFSCVAKDLEACREKRDAWLAQR